MEEKIFIVYNCYVHGYSFSDFLLTSVSFKNHPYSNSPILSDRSHPKLDLRSRTYTFSNAGTKNVKISPRVVKFGFFHSKFDRASTTDIADGRRSGVGHQQIIK